MPGDLSALGDLVLEVGGDLSPLEKTLNQDLPEAARRAAASLDEALGAGLGGAGSNLGNLDAALGAVPPKLEELGQAAGGATPPLQGFNLSWKSFVEGFAAITGIELGIELLKDLAEAAIGTAAAIEKSVLTLTALTGSIEHAEAQIEGLKTLALSDALSFPTLLQANQKMMALGFSATQTAAALRASADAAAATGKSLDMVTSGIDRIAQSGMLGARQLATLGLSLNDVAKAMGATVADLQGKDNIFKALDPGDRIDVLIQAMSKFQGAAQGMAESLTGQFQRLKTEITLALSGIGEALTPALKDLVNVAQGSLVPGIQALVQGFKDLAAVLGPLVSGVLSSVVSGLGDIATVVGSSLSAISELIGALATIGFNLATTGQAAGTFEFSWKGLLDTLRVTEPFHILATEIQIATGSVSMFNQAAGIMRQRFVDTTEELKKFIDKATANTGLLSIRLEMEAQNKALADAKAKLADVTAAYQQNMATAGQVKDAQDAVNKALYAMDPAAKTAADAAHKFGGEISSFVKSLDSLLHTVPQTYEAYIQTIDDGGAKASASVSKLQQDVTKALELISRGATATQVHLTELMDALARAKDFAATDAFYKLAQQVDDVASKYPLAIGKLDTATLDWINSMQTAARDIPEALNRITDAQALEHFLSSTQKLEEAQLKLGETTGKVYGKMREDATKQIEITKDWSEIIATVGNEWVEMADGLAKVGIKLDAVMRDNIAFLQRQLELTQQFGQPLSIQLELQSRILIAQQQQALALGASADTYLKLSEQLTAVQIKQAALQDETMGLSNLYTGMVKSFGEAWHSVSTGIADAVVSGQNFGQVFTQVLDTLKKQLAELVVDYLMTKVKDAILTNTGLLEGFNKVFNNIFGGGAGGGGALDVLKQAQENAAGAAKAISETFASADQGIKQVQQTSSQAMSSVTTSAVSAIGNMVSMVTGIISAITGIIEVFQLSHMNKLLGEIEVSTRKTWIVTGEQADSIQYNTKWMSLNLNDLKNWIGGPQFTALTNISSSLDAINFNVEKMMWDIHGLAQSGIGGGAGGGTSGTGSTLVDALLDQIKKIQGALTVLNENVSGPYGLGPAVTGLASATDGLSTSFSDLSGAASSLNDSLTTTAAAAGAGVSTFSPTVPKLTSSPGGGPSPSMGTFEIHTTVYAGVVAGSNGMQQLSDMVSHNVITKLRQVAGLKV